MARPGFDAYSAGTSNVRGRTDTPAILPLRRAPMMVENGIRADKLRSDKKWRPIFHAEETTTEERKHAETNMRLHGFLLTKNSSTVA